MHFGTRDNSDSHSRNLFGEARNVISTAVLSRSLSASAYYTRWIAGRTAGVITRDSCGERERVRAIRPGISRHHRLARAGIWTIVEIAAKPSRYSPGRSRKIPFHSTPDDTDSGTRRTVNTLPGSGSITDSSCASVSAVCRRIIASNF